MTTAIRKLELSQLNPAAVGQNAINDLNLKAFSVYLSSQLRTNVVDRLIDATINLSIEESNVLEVVIDDWDRTLLNSGLLSNKLDVQVDGLWFRLSGSEKSDDELTLTFATREIEVLRTYNTWKIARRSKTTRAEFVLNMIREVKDFDTPIPVVIPELHKVQPIERYNGDKIGVDSIINKNKGISSDVNKQPVAGVHRDITVTPGPTNLMVKTALANETQIRNANIILAVGESESVRRKLLVCSIMTAIQESDLKNLPQSQSDGDSAGIFQQRPNWGSLTDRMNVETSARLFFKAAKDHDAADPNRPYWDLCQAIQGSAHPEAYAQWRLQAERFVSAYGIVGTDSEGAATEANGMAGQQNAASGDYYFYRGKLEDKRGQRIRQPENSWGCIQRLADEVDYRAFFVGGVFYWISEDLMFKQKPIATIREFDESNLGIDGDYHNAAKSAALTVKTRSDRWAIPPGSVVVVKDMGPWSGRWIVSEIDRSLFKSDMTVILKKPRPMLPEPFQSNAADINTSWIPKPGPRDTTGTGSSNAPFGGLPGANGTREAVVKVALYAYAEEQKNHYHYSQTRPMPIGLFVPAAHNPGIDCSTFVTLVYKEAGCADPNGNSYNASGNTQSLVTQGRQVLQPTEGDLVFYGGTSSFPAHVAVYIGGGKVIEIGSEAGISELPVNYRSDLNQYRSYISI